jgi:hypothetical protein
MTSKTFHVMPALMAVLALFAGPATAADLVPLEWTAEGRFEKDLTVPAGKFVEVCGKLAAKDSVRWQFEASAPMNFNIHYHEGKKVLFPAKRDQVDKASDVLDVKLAQDYCWMWTNKTTAPASLKLALQK